MNTTLTPSDKFSLPDQLIRLRQACLSRPMPSLTERRTRLTQLKGALLAHKQALCDALALDYGQRSGYDSLIADILPCVMQINYSLKRLKGWMRPERRHPGLLLAPARVEVHYQPLGVVGIMVPWNFPVMLSLGPLIGAIGAGNRAMIKLSEFTPRTNAVLRTLLGEVFADDEVMVIEGDAELAAAFSALPFDHLVFTGSTAVGRRVMAAAAPHLTPLTLELGGKSPCLIAPDMPMALAVERMIFGKSLNAGQICVAPDYVLLPRGQEQAFVEAYRSHFTRLYPKGLASPDYGSVVNAQQYARLTAWLDEARQAGAQVHPCTSPARDDSAHRLAPHLLTEVPDHCQVMQQEIFGPLLPIVPYDSLDEAIAYVAARPRPLALYLMSLDEPLQRRLIRETHAGGMAINESLFQAAADDAPFGGIGPSGMGHYHGREGFLTFSKAKTVLRRGRFSPGGLIHPPYRRWYQRLMMALFLR
ncbi:coniferyl aldehyde dehydrogenase [Aeromonas taiwanensis]|uniref:Aldehyde dehydrogenase n=1 Tax=Aeromonas taiwanensis TaxID=633417 RepID=A0A5F0KBS5_9GAMM|nr:coniferyl aldehyde dehydrogenase [Aeromonas taiwanensis]TFF76937.1 coniferyl aldehyde dehydrogenase [Aeromonas taiwanensis]TFF77634.1 coniferyl aldehyde dehydrogenase [Aeromonas taiwanensis]TFF81593.1 coniferyl aldehyde dehydrogenase [Aeromonas taiwanensis]